MSRKTIGEVCAILFIVLCIAGDCLAQDFVARDLLSDAYRRYCRYVDSGVVAELDTCRWLCDSIARHEPPTSALGRRARYGQAWCLFRKAESERLADLESRLQEASGWFDSVEGPEDLLWVQAQYMRA